MKLFKMPIDLFFCVEKFAKEGHWILGITKDGLACARNFDGELIGGGCCREKWVLEGRTCWGVGFGKGSGKVASPMGNNYSARSNGWLGYCIDGVVRLMEVMGQSPCSNHMAAN